jgi:hypothetical protein
VKSWMMIFGPLPSSIPLFTLSGKVITYTPKHTYVGLSFRSTHTNIFTDHYGDKAAKARSCGYLIYGAESLVGKSRLPPREARILYFARVDPHLISGCEVIIDVDNTIKKLETVQHRWLRRLLKLNSRSPIAPLFTELAIMPIRCRRILLALRYLRYLLQLPATHYARIALESAQHLLVLQHPSWLTDLQWAMGHLPTPVLLPHVKDLNSLVLDDIDTRVKRSVCQSLQAAVDGSVRLYLLHGRREPLENSPPRHITLYLRHYLTMVTIPEHRHAITRLILGDHPLASEQLRRGSRYHAPVPPHLRLCRLCALYVESPEHVLMSCIADPQLTALREQCYGECSQQGVVCTSALLLAPHNALPQLKALLFDRRTVQPLARFTSRAFKVMESVPMLRLQ